MFFVYTSRHWVTYLIVEISYNILPTLPAPESGKLRNWCVVTRLSQLRQVLRAAETRGTQSESNPYFVPGRNSDGENRSHSEIMGPRIVQIVTPPLFSALRNAFFTVLVLVQIFRCKTSFRVVFVVFSPMSQLVSRGVALIRHYCCLCSEAFLPLLPSLHSESSDSGMSCFGATFVITRKKVHFDSPHRQRHQETKEKPNFMPLPRYATKVVEMQQGGCRVLRRPAYSEVMDREA